MRHAWPIVFLIAASAWFVAAIHILGHATSWDQLYPCLWPVTEVVFALYDRLPTRWSDSSVVAEALALGSVVANSMFWAAVLVGPAAVLFRHFRRVIAEHRNFDWYR